MTDGREDINRQVVREWISDTTPEERVRSIMKRTYDPQTVDQIADRARVTPIRAASILGEFADEGFVNRVAGDDDGDRWHRAPESLASEVAARLDRD